jgi:hypothetical protein
MWKERMTLDYFSNTIISASITVISLTHLSGYPGLKIRRPTRLYLAVLAASIRRIPIYLRGHVLNRHLAACSRALEQHSVCSMNSGIVNHAFAQKVRAAIALESQPSNHLVGPAGRRREDGNRCVARLGGLILDRFVIDGRRFYRGAAREQCEDCRQSCNNQCCTTRAHER